MSLARERGREKERQPARRECGVYAREAGGGANKREPCFVSFGSGFAPAFVRHETQRRVERTRRWCTRWKKTKKTNGGMGHVEIVLPYSATTCEPAVNPPSRIDPFLPSFLPDALLPSSPSTVLPFLPPFAFYPVSLLFARQTATRATLRLYFVVVAARSFVVSFFAGPSSSVREILKLWPRNPNIRARKIESTSPGGIFRQRRVSFARFPSPLLLLAPSFNPPPRSELQSF